MVSVKSLKIIGATLLTSIALSGALSPSATAVAYAAESNIHVTRSFEDKTIAELSQEAADRQQLKSSDLSQSVNQQAIANSNAKKLESKIMNMTVQEVKENLPELMKEFDGAGYLSRAVSGLGTKLANGGWNMYYKTQAGRSAVYNFYDRIFYAAAGNDLYNVIVDALAVACGVTVAGAIILAITGFIAGAVTIKVSNARGLVSSHGNTGTVRVTLSDELWSSKYDNNVW